MEDKNKIDSESVELENLNRTAVTITEATVVSNDPTAGNDSSAGMTMATVGEPTQPTPQPTQPTSQPTQPTKPEDSPELKSKSLKDGDQLGKYRIVKRLGKGGMGEVFLAKHEQLDILRAIKVLPDDLARTNNQFFSRFIREAKTACEIRHSNIVNVMDVETDPVYGVSYIVMEYVDGGDVRGLLKSSGRLTVDQTLVIVEAVTSALAAASEYGIVHRDIKPDNIMLTRRGEVKLADLGIAKSGEEDVQLTRTNVMMGTPAYLSPEQAKDAKHVDIRADIYSLGATMFEMLTGRIPYPGSSVYDILSKLYSEPVPNPCDFNPDVPPEIGKIVMTMMAKKPEHRYQNAAELLEVLSRCRAHQKTVIEAQKIIRDAIQTAYGTEGVRTPILSTTMQRRRTGKKVAILVLAACLTVIIILAILFMLLRKKTASTEPVADRKAPVTVSPAQSSVAGKGSAAASPAQSFWSSQSPRQVTNINIMTPARGSRGGITIIEVKTGNPELDKYIARNGAEIKLKGSNDVWRKVRFPYTVKNLKEGKYYMMFRIPEKRIRGQESEEIEVEEGKLTEYSMFLATF